MYLAAASGEDLATTSDIVTDALTAFGLTAADSGHFADVLAAASSNANTNVSMMGETFKYCAPDEGPLTDFESWMPDFMSGLAEGIEKSRGMVKAAVNSVAADMVISPQMDVADGGVMTGTGTSCSADLIAGIVAALRDVLGDQKGQ